MAQISIVSLNILATTNNFFPKITKTYDVPKKDNRQKITVFNTGNTIAYINNCPILPNTSFESNTIMTIDTTQYTITFDAGTNPECCIVETLFL